ncbi:MAG TPA: lipoprotein [Ohtaekwangia sp.]|nr:lipoprotein [Ohtaekwangia sp.]
MKRIPIIVTVFALILSACASPKPYYQTKKGKKKQKYYNEIQFGGKSASEMRKP